MKPGHLTTQKLDKRVDTMIADFLGLNSELRREYIEALSELLCTHKRLYPTRRSGYAPPPPTSSGRAPAMSVE